MQRETKTFETLIGKNQVEIKTYLTGREKRALTNVFLTSELNFDPDNGSVKGMNAELIDKAQDLAWQTVIVSIDGSNENIVDKILDMRVEDYNQVIEEVNKITSVKQSEEKKTS